MKKVLKRTISILLILACLPGLGIAAFGDSTVYARTGEDGGMISLSPAAHPTADGEENGLPDENTPEDEDNTPENGEYTPAEDGNLPAENDPAPEKNTPAEENADIDADVPEDGGDAPEENGAEGEEQADTDGEEDLLPEYDAEVPTAADGALTASVTWTTPCAGSEMTFTVNASGGGGNYKYRFYSITDGEMMLADVSLSRQEGIQAMIDSNELHFTFMASGTYYVKFQVFDNTEGSYQNYFTDTYAIVIDDPAYPSVAEIVSETAAECCSVCTTDSEKALWLHDRLINNANYDYTYTYCNAEGVLARGTGTCESYQRAYAKLLDAVGIPNGRVEGNNHTWNVVQIGGSWYQIDPTWDDVGSSGRWWEYHINYGLTDDLMALVHSSHTAASGYECTSYEENYFIKTGRISAWTDPLQSAIQSAVDAKQTAFTVTIDSTNVPSDFYYSEQNWYDNTYTLMYTLAAYSLTGTTWTASDGTQVTLTAECTGPKELTFTANYPCETHTSGAAVTENSVEPTCTEAGHYDSVIYCSVCGSEISRTTVTVPAAGHTPVTDPEVPASKTGAGLTEGSHCSVCGKVLTAQEIIPEYYVCMGLPEGTQVLAGGMNYTADADGCILLPDGSVTIAETFTYNTVSDDPHDVYPIGMKVYELRFADGVYTAKHISGFDDILQYAGSSIRIRGTKGIRMITSILASKRNQLTGSGIEGYTLLEYGTIVQWESDLGGAELTAETAFNGAYAYKKDIADPIFKRAGGKIQYTNVLVGFSMEQCSPDLAMRPYMILLAPDGTQVTLYGGTVQRSIGYIAWQNRDVFASGTAAYEYVHEIIDAAYDTP